MRSIAILLSSSVLVAACSLAVPTPSITSSDAGRKTDATPAAAPKPKTVLPTLSLKANGGTAPPANAKSKGKLSLPKAGRLQVPIKETEAYTYEADFNGDETPDTIYWAHLETGITYLWASGSIECNEGPKDDNGGFMMGVNSDGTGTYLFAAQCSDGSGFFGCDFDATGKETVCGDCTVGADNQLACVPTQ